MAGSYLGHGAKYWADRYFESQTQTHLPDDPADLSWRDKYLALEKECSSYQATLADLRTEVEYLRTQRPVKYVPDLMSEQEAEKWESAYRRLYAHFVKKKASLMLYLKKSIVRTYIKERQQSNGRICIFPSRVTLSLCRLLLKRKILIFRH